MLLFQVSELTKCLIQTVPCKAGATDCVQSVEIITTPCAPDALGPETFMEAVLSLVVWQRQIYVLILIL